LHHGSGGELGFAASERLLDLTRHLPIGRRASQRRLRSIEALNTPFAIGEAAIALGERLTRQDNIRQGRCFGQEHLEHDVKAAAQQRGAQGVFPIRSASARNRTSGRLPMIASVASLV